MTSAVYGSVFIILLAEVIYSQRLQGDRCTYEPTDSPGECKLLNRCHEALEQLRKFRRYPQTCGFQETKPIVCCPLDETVKKRKPGEISYKKCQEYSNYKRKLNVCDREIFIVGAGGEAADRGEFPHMAAIGFDMPQGDIKWLCGGSIISELYILTAAHCLSSRTFGPVKYVRTGVNNLKSDSMYRQDFLVAERIAHPDYKSHSFYNDIGLLKLDKAVTINAYSRPACLYLNRNIEAKRVIATGWGETDQQGTRPDDLVKITQLGIIDPETCNKSYKSQISRRFRNGIVEDTQFCAGSLDDVKRDTCEGDSGGPLQIDHTGDDIKCMHDIIGITSFGRASCGLGNTVYTRVSYFVQWIEDIVWPDVS